MMDSIVDKYKQYAPISNIEHDRYIVKKCRNLLTGDTVAMKHILVTDKYGGVPSSAIREVSLLRELEHDNIVRLLDVLSKEKKISLVYECLDVNLQKFMQTQPMRPDTIKKFLHQILHGVAYCHSHKIIHRDLKPGNLLIDRSNDRVKLADFGYAMAIDDPLVANELTTLPYMAPEFLLGNSHYSTPVDVWSVACIFAEMVTHQRLFHDFFGFGPFGQLRAIFRIMGKPNEAWPWLIAFHRHPSLLCESNAKDLAKEVPGLEPAGVDLLYKMLIYDPNKRITAQEALEHEYFKDVQDVH